MGTEEVRRGPTTDNRRSVMATKQVLLGVILVPTLWAAPTEAAGGEIHLRLKYSGSTVTREDSNHDGIKYWAFGYGAFHPEAPIAEGGFYEFSVPRMGVYAVFDGNMTR